MLQFFRKYNRYILAIGVSLLMVAFLVQPTMQMFGPNPQKRTLGYIDGAKVTALDIQEAANQLGLLQYVLRAGVGAYEPMQWFLMRHEAEEVGAVASLAQAAEFLRNTGIGEQELSQIAERHRITIDMLHAAVRDWITVQHYSELLYGVTSMPLTLKASLRGLAYLQTLRDSTEDHLSRFLRASHGSFRVSRPLMQRFIYDYQSTVRISAVTVDTDAYADKIEIPTEQDLLELFDQYKLMLPGESEPYGFGYRYPDRVKIEYLEIPAALLRREAKKKTQEREALAYYTKHPADFLEPQPPQNSEGDNTSQDSSAPSNPKVKPYAQVRQEILNQLYRDNAKQLGQEILKAAQSMLANHNRSLDTASGYFVVDNDTNWKPMRFDKLAENLQERFGILPSWHHHDRRWFDRQGLGDLPGIGLSRLTDNGTSLFADYVFSAKELSPDSDNDLATRRLQKAIASLPLAVAESFYIFRLIDVQPAHSPASLEEVRTRVTYDAKRLAGYRMLQNDKQSWLERARTETLETIAQQLGANIRKPSPFSRRVADLLGGLAVPNIVGIGSDQILVDRIFELARQGDDVATDVIGVDKKQVLLLVRVEEFDPITTSQFKTAVANPLVALNLITQSYVDELGSDPLAYEALVARVGYIPEVDESDPFTESQADASTDDSGDQ